jgi:hypothetical protein
VQDLARLAQELSEARAQMEAAVEQVCSANMATEQAVSKAAGDRERLDEALQQLAAQAGLAAERDRLAVQVQHYALLKQKYAQKSAALKEVRRRGGRLPCLGWSLLFRLRLFRVVHRLLLQ